MTNAYYGQTYYATTVGIISNAPVVVKAISQYPAAVQDAFSLAWWDEANPLTSGLAFNATVSSGAVTDTNATHDVMTSTVFPAGGVVQVTYSDGAAANKTYHLISGVGDNDHFDAATWSDETAINYTVKTYPARVAFDGLQSKLADTLESKFWFFGDAGIRLPNLVLSSISDSSHLIIYIE